MTTPFDDVRTTAAHFGRSARRVEDFHLLRGQAEYVDNLHEEGELFLGVIRSPLAHGRITRVDVSPALEKDGVVAAFAARDLLDSWMQVVPVIAPEGAYRTEQWPLAQDKVRFVGEPIAVVLATSRYVAADAKELVEFDLEPLPAVSGIEAALQAEVLIHDGAGTNLAFEAPGPVYGDPDAVFANADVVVERRYVQQRLMATALETRSVLALPDADGTLTVRLSTQVPHRTRDLICAVLGLETDRVRVIATDVGGGFGPKLDTYAEELLCSALALRLGRPVRYTGDRIEDFQSTNHGRAQEQHIAVAASRDGTLLGLRVKVVNDCGGYLSRNGALLPVNGGKIFPGCYRWQAYEFVAQGVFTNATPVGAYRGAGRPEATFGVERAIDDVAAELGIDPAELRAKNFPSPEEFPFPSAGGFDYDSGDYGAALRLALEAADYDSLRTEQAERRHQNSTRPIGIGLASYVDRCGVGPGLPEYAQARLCEDGRFEVLTGLEPTGQGTVTSLAQIAADALGTRPELVSVVHGDTGRVPSGKGTFGSRSMSVGGVAVHQAASGLCDLMLEASSRLFEVGEAVATAEGEAVPPAELAAAVARGVLPGMGLGDLAVSVEYEPDGLTFPFGTHLAVVEVDLETGLVTLRRFIAVDDCGRVVNPSLLEGQLHGGIAQGVAQALYEEARYDEDGNPTSSSLVDYLAPTAPDLPDFELHRTVTPAPNPLGVKGVGESGTIGAPPAVVNAVVDALRHVGVKDISMPCTPQRVWDAVRGAATSSQP